MPRVNIEFFRRQRAQCVRRGGRVPAARTDGALINDAARKAISNHRRKWVNCDGDDERYENDRKNGSLRVSRGSAYRKYVRYRGAAEKWTAGEGGEGDDGGRAGTPKITPAMKLPQ